jgi:sodium-dependent dicarboxylate transporter 2/3/5
VLGGAQGASLGFMMPISTPPNAIVYGTGYVPAREMMRAGFVLDALGFVVTWTALRLLLPVLGLA